MFLHLNLEKDHNLDRIANYQVKLINGLQLFLSSRSRRDEAQITSLFRALLEFSNGRVDVRQHRFAQEYTASEHANLYASVLNIVRTKHFGDYNLDEMCNTLSTSPAFFRKAISVQDLEEWTTKMMNCLRRGFREGHLV